MTEQLKDLQWTVLPVAEKLLLGTHECVLSLRHVASFGMMCMLGPQRA